MAKTKAIKAEKQPKKAKEKEFKGETAVPIYDILNWLTYEKKPWEQISEVNRKKIHNDKFIINRFLSMNLNMIEAVNDLQESMLQMDGAMFYRVYFELLPQQKDYNKFIKAQEEKYPPEDIAIMVKYFSVSRDIAIDYYETMLMTEKGKANIQRIKNNYFYELKKPKGKEDK